MRSDRRGVFAALVAVFLLPYVIFIEAYMGLALYIRETGYPCFA